MPLRDHFDKFSHQKFQWQSFHSCWVNTIVRQLNGPLLPARFRAVPLSQPPRLDVWFNPLEIGKPLPTLPLWIADDLAVPLDLEQSYEETCRVLRG